jgi:cyclopropane-fatty-acyl-phospholipid synthase
METSKSLYETVFEKTVVLHESYWKSKTREILELGGIHLNGPKPWDIQVSDERFYPRVFAHHSLGLGESYLDGWWDASRLDDFFYHVFKADLDEKVNPTWELAWIHLKALTMNLQSQDRAFEVGERHYDLGNNLFQAMLDSHMAYTCGYWKNAGNLDQAQAAKLDLVCHKIGLGPDKHVLDVGGGWGSFAKFAAEWYGAKVTAITISREQAELGRERCKGLPVEIRLQDYRDLGDEKFDHIVSLGMFEHVGYKNHRRFMEIMNSCLNDDGLFLLHTIGNNKSETETDPWIDKYIFPNSLIPSIGQVGSAIEGLFVMEDWHNFGLDYDKTLMAWFGNFNDHWDEIKPRYDNRFYRMWKYYLLQCAGLFRARKKQLWQIVLSKNGKPEGYVAPR